MAECIHLTVSCPLDLRNLMKEKNISPSEALRMGIKALMDAPFHSQQGETIEQESYKAKFIASERRERAMRELLDKIPLQILEQINTRPSSTEDLSPKTTSRGEAL